MGNMQSTLNSSNEFATIMMKLDYSYCYPGCDLTGNIYIHVVQPFQATSLISFFKDRNMLNGLLMASNIMKGKQISVDTHSGLSNIQVPRSIQGNIFIHSLSLYQNSSQPALKWTRYPFSTPSLLNSSLHYLRN